MGMYGIVVDVSDERILSLKEVQEQYIELRDNAILYNDRLTILNSKLVLAQVNEMLPKLLAVRMCISTQANMMLHSGRSADTLAFAQRMVGRPGRFMSLSRDDVGSPLDYSLVVGHNALAQEGALHSLVYWATIHNFYLTAAELRHELYQD